MTENDFFLEAKKFLADLERDCLEQKILWQEACEKDWMIDHLCFRTDTQENYLYYKVLFGSFGHLLIESMVGGRLISTFALNHPIPYQGKEIKLVELPAPKIGKKTTLGFEHIEVVSDRPFSEIQKMFAHVPQDLKGLDKEFNQELEICLGPRNIKFHHYSLQSVINLEKNEQVWTALEQTKILKLFKKNDPLVFGNSLLGLPEERPVLHVALNSHSLPILAGELRDAYGAHTAFSCSHKEKSKQALNCEFFSDGVLFVITAENIPSVKQDRFMDFHLRAK